MLHFIKLKEKGDENEMKKWTARILAMLMILALVGCGGDSGSTDESGGSDGRHFS